MDIEPGSPEQIIEERIARLIDDLDELCALACDPKGAPLVQGQRIPIGMVVTRSRVLAALLIARDPVAA